MTRRLVAALAGVVVVGGSGLSAAATAPATSCADPGPAEAGFSRLWDGVSDPTTSGWTQSGPGRFRVVDDGPVQGCRLVSEGGLGLLWYSAERFSDHVLRLQWRTEDATDNSGVFFGFPADGARTHETAIARGYEVQIREGTPVDGEPQKTGSIYNNQPAAVPAARPAGEWNDYEVRVERPVAGQGVRVTVRLNGTVVNVFQSPSATRAAGLGHLGLQNHGTADSVSFRDVRVQALRDEEPPTTSATVEGTRTADGAYAGPARVSFTATDGPRGRGVARTEYRVDGGAWQTYTGKETVLLDSTEESFRQWKQAGPGSFARLPDGSIVGQGGLGMLWHPMELGDVAVKMQYRDLRPANGSSNAGVFVRFPDPAAAAARPAAERFPCQTGSATTQPAWVAISCGHEVQIYEGATGEPQKTGSVYNFQPLDLDQAGGGPAPLGQWTDYEVRVQGGGDYTLTVLRDGKVINVFRNSPGKRASRAGDAPTELRQFARGHVGLQNHGSSDSMQFRDVRVRDLSPPVPVVVAAAGTHVVEFRSVDEAGNTEATRSTEIRVS